MGRIYYIMGKSATGKDTIYKEVLKQRPDLKTIVMYTTRPIREGEADGVEYHFRSISEMEELRDSGKMIECRMYQTVFGPWYYFTMDDKQFDLESDAKYLMIGTLESYEKMLCYFGEDTISPIFIEVPDGIRLQRAVARESQQKKPNYKETCRRYLADEDDFAEENLNRLGIQKRYINLELDECMKSVLEDIL